MKRQSTTFFGRASSRAAVALAATALAATMPMAATANAAARPVRVYPLGDSITHGFDGDGYRPALFEITKQNGIEAEFVGSLDAGRGPGRAHDGHDGAVIDTLNARLEEWLGRFRPDVILLMIGANDIETGASEDVVVGKLRALLDRIARLAPKTRVLLSEITVIREPRFDRAAVAINARLRTLAGERITVVPMHDAIGVEDLRDLDHPLPRGNRKIAERFWTYLEPVLKQVDLTQP